jgi:fatty-acyl-CoA synthase
VKSTLAGLPIDDQRRLRARTGRAIIGVEIRVVDDSGCDVPRDNQTVGEIIARGDGVMEGYWNQPEETRTAFRDGWLLTGDMAVWDEHGYVLIVDRKKEIIISGGENISSLEIERALAAHPAVYESAVIAVPDEKWGEVPKALVVLKENCAASEGELLAFLRGRIANFKVPKSVEFFPGLPKGGTGKILKKVLREKYWTGHAKRVH